MLPVEQSGSERVWSAVELELHAVGRQGGCFLCSGVDPFFKSENTEESDQSATNETTYFSLVYGVLTVPFSFMIRIKAFV